MYFIVIENVFVGCNYLKCGFFIDWVVMVKVIVEIVCDIVFDLFFDVFVVWLMMG